MSREENGITYYTIRFLNYTGDDLLGTAEVESGEDATSLAPIPETIEGKKFIGWNVSITNVIEDMTVRPVYEDLIPISFYDDEGRLLKKVSVEKGDTASPPPPTIHNDRIFIGWNGSYVNIQGPGSVIAMYRSISTHPQLDFYDATSGRKKKSYHGVNACSISQKLSGECTISLKLLTRQTEGIISIDDRVEVEGLVFYLTEIKKSVSGGMCYSEYTGEHISYLLNDETYKVTAMDRTGTAEELLGAILSGTPFTPGEVSGCGPQKVTIRVNRESTRRAVLMQLLALYGAEITYYGYSIGMSTHAGKTNRIDLMKSSIVSDISCSYSKTDGKINYSLNLYRKGNLTLGDEISLNFAPMGIHENNRIVGIEWNPFNYKDVSITIGSYLPDLNDSLYEITQSVEDIRSTTAKYTIEFGEMIGNGTFYFTRSYNDRPYFQTKTSDGSTPSVTLNRSDGTEFSSYIGATLSGVNSRTVTLLVFYCTLPEEESS